MTLTKEQIETIRAWLDRRALLDGELNALCDMALCSLGAESATTPISEPTEAMYAAVTWPVPPDYDQKKEFLRIYRSMLAAAPAEVTRPTPADFDALYRTLNESGGRCYPEHVDAIEGFFKRFSAAPVKAAEPVATDLYLAARRVYQKYGADSDWTEWTDLRDALAACVAEAFATRRKIVSDTPRTDAIIEAADACPQTRVVFLIKNLANLAKEMEREVARLATKSDAEMERVKACEHIANGDEGWQVLRELCPSTSAVSHLRDRYEASVALPQRGTQK